MADTIFSPQTQPVIDCILANINYRRLDNIFKILIGGATILADELFTNVDANVYFLTLAGYFYNNEGANRYFTFRNTGGFAMIVTINIPTTNGVSMAQYVLFNNIIASGALVNAGTTLTFNGYRILT